MLQIKVLYKYKKNLNLQYLRVFYSLQPLTESTSVKYKKRDGL